MICDHVLEHLDDPIGMLRQVHDWIDPDGVFIVSVPNAFSLHRLLGVEMGLLDSPDQLNDLDLSLGHRRVYDSRMLTDHLAQAGWEVLDLKGSFVKIFSNEQMKWMLASEIIGDAQIRGLAALAGRIPDYASDIFAVAVPAPTDQGHS